MKFDDALAALYAAAPSEFITRRDAIVAELKLAHQVPLAEEVHSLRKPSLAAWALNLLARERPEELARLVQLGVDLRSAQSLLTGTLIRSLTAQRHQLVASVTKLACATAAEHGHSLGSSAAQEVSDTVTAGLVSEEAAHAVSSGLLTRALSYAGFGDVDVSEATAVPARQRALRPSGRSRTAATPGLASLPRESAPRSAPGPPRTSPQPSSPATTSCRRSSRRPPPTRSCTPSGRDRPSSPRAPRSWHER